MALAVLALGALLKGCSGGTEVIASLTSALPSSNEAAQPLNFGPADPTRQIKFASEPSYVANTLSANDLIVVRDAKVEAYLRSVALRLLAHWKGPQPSSIGVFVQASPAINATATPHGDIFITLGALDRFRSEDELAVLIAHELGHILLGHHENNKTAKKIADVASIGMVVAIGAAMVTNTSMRKVGDTREFYLSDQNAFMRQSGRALAAAIAVKTLSTDVALHAFSRYQEYAADRFGIELARHAGYDVSAMSDILDAFRAGEAAAAERKRSLQNVQIPTSVQGAIFTVATELFKGIMDDHPSAADRDEAIKKHFAASGLANERPPARRSKDYLAAIDQGRFARLRQMHRLLTEALDATNVGDAARAEKLTNDAIKLVKDSSPDARLVLYAVLRAQGRFSEADNILVSAPLRERASLDFYRTLAQVHATRGDHNTAAKVLARADGEYGKPTSLYPTKITLARMAQNAAAVQTLMSECSATKDDALVKVCAAAVTGADPEAEYKADGGLFSILAGRQSGNPAFAGNGASSTPAPLPTFFDPLRAVTTAVGSVVRP